MYKRQVWWTNVIPALSVTSAKRGAAEALPPAAAQTRAVRAATAADEIPFDIEQALDREIRGTPVGTPKRYRPRSPMVQRRDAAATRFAGTLVLRSAHAQRRLTGFW